MGAGSVWVGVQEEGDPGALVRIDLATSRVVAEVPVADSPARKQIAATDHAVWVGGDGAIERIDPATDVVVQRVQLPGRYISALTADDTAVWAIAVDRSSASTLIRIDATTDAVVAEIPLEAGIAGYEDQVLLASGSVWVLGVTWIEEENAEYGSDLIRVDPDSNEIVARIDVDGFHMAAGDGEIWVEFPADGVFDSYDERWRWAKVDVDNNQPSEPFTFDSRGLEIVSPDALWSVGYDENDYVRITRFDPDLLTKEAESAPIRSYYHDAIADPSSGSVWVSTQEGVVRVDINKGPNPDAATTTP
ncbi:MAG: hypothetical protein WEA10_02575 [Actinomycetota bacterium]